MKIVKLKGGLGNQFFQYAFARVISINQKSKVYLDTSDFMYSTHRVKRSLDLNKFNIKLKLISELGLIYRNWLIYRFNKYFVTYEEEGINYNDSLINLKNNIIFDGYWQSFKYFDSIRTILQQELVIKTKLSKSARLIKDQLKFKKTVAVHFRRGDYITDLKTNQVHGVIDMSYYKEAFTYFDSYCDNLLFVVFSDDIESIKNELSINKKFLFIDSLYSHLEEFEIMKGCDHFIIANSTFSWWAAWLGSNEEKQVLAPKRWFKDELLESQSENLIPHDWIRL
jgi:hypothetical protein